MAARQYDAHVRARRTLARRVVDRRMDWGMSLLYTPKDAKRIGWDRIHEMLTESAYDAIGAHKWSKGWSEKLSTYQPFGPRQHVIGTYADVPASEIHSIMCNLDVHFKPRLAAERAKAAAKRAKVGEPAA